MCVTSVVRRLLEIVLGKLSNIYRPMIRDWRVLAECSFSDCCLIPFSINLSIGSQKPYRNPRRTDWNKFENSVEQKLRAFRVVPFLASMLKFDL